MIRVRWAPERGETRLDWLSGFHTFSFGGYRDPAWMGFGTLRVLNEDVIAPGGGFPPHPHRDMEIVTWILEGALRHEDSLGNGSVIRPGEVQRMTAGTGVVHSEMNASATEPVHLLQIWILPDRKGLPPGYEQRRVPAAARDGAILLAAPPGQGGAVSIRQDARILAGRLARGGRLGHPLAAGRRAWLQVVRGSVELGGERLSAGDGAGITGEREVSIDAPTAAEFLLFDLTD